MTPAGIACGSGGPCSFTAPAGTTVTLLATPKPNNTFAGWGGVCTGPGSSCTFTLTTASTATATFIPAPTNPKLTIALAGAGSGTVTCAGIPCLSSYPWGTTIALSATPVSTDLFSGWQDACAGTSTTTCTLTLTTDTRVTAAFTTPLPSATLTVIASGAGSVTSNPDGINCGAGCAAQVPGGTQLTLTATPAQRFVFTGWSGSGVTCPGTTACTVTLSGNLTVTAAFAPATVTYALNTVVGDGTGSILCNGATCQPSYPAGSEVTLTPASGAGYIFDHWSDACSGSNPTCSLTISAASIVTAYFKKPTLSIVLAPAGTQTIVTSTPAGISCGSSCQASFDAGTSVTLTVTVPTTLATASTATAAFIPIPTNGLLFSGWSGGGCSGTALTCSISLTADTIVTAQLSGVNGYVYPLTLGPTGRYLVDQTGKPFLLVGDAAWSLIAALSDADADLYLANRQQLGFTAVLANLLEHQFAHAPPADFYGLLPFTGKAFTTPNEAYFTHVDTILQSAATRGIVVLLDVLYLGFGCGGQGWCNEVKAATTSDMTSWGQYVGNRYKNYDNIVWVIGGDTNPTQVKSKVQAMVDGILSVNSRHPFTAHNAPEQMAVTPWTGASWLNVNNVYTDNPNNPAYQSDLTAYAISPAKPFFLIESQYENEGANLQALRAQSYWTVLSGGFGHVFGNCPIWAFGYDGQFCTPTDWKAQLNNQGSINMQRFQALFRSRHWHTLVPDTQHTVMMAGYGSSGQADYATTAYASDGSSIIAYLPTSRPVTMSGSSITGPSMIAWWYNPSTGAATQIGTFATTGTQTFPPPSSGDWVLVLDSASFAFPPPGTS